MIHHYRVVRAYGRRRVGEECHAEGNPRDATLTAMGFQVLLGVDRGIGLVKRRSRGGKVGAGQAGITAFSRNQATLLVARTARKVEASAQTLTPVRQPNENGRPGGRLRSSIGTRIGGTAHVVTARVGSKVKYAEPAHQGAGPHVIRPRRKQFLSFKWNKAKQYGIPLTKRARRSA